MTTRYTEEHEWVREENGTYTVGITDYAQEQLGEIVFVELPEVGSAVSQGAEAAVIESVKAASELKSPISGKVTAVNEALDGEPETINSAPEGDGWFFRMEADDAGELDALMDADAYQQLIDSL